MASILLLPLHYKWETDPIVTQSSTLYRIIPLVATENNAF